MLGNQGDSCEQTCSKDESICNTNAQSNLATEELMKKAMLAAGYKCKRFIRTRGYIGAPLAQGNSNALECGVITLGTKSVCDFSPCDSSECETRRLCYCQKGCIICPYLSHKDLKNSVRFYTSIIYIKNCILRNH